MWDQDSREGREQDSGESRRPSAGGADQGPPLAGNSSLGGVTPADVHYGRKIAKQREIDQYREEESRREVPTWTRDYWTVLKSGLGLGKMSDDELLTKSAFFGRRPLRRIARRNRECVG
ncbi:MAG TPA: hypothetical protein DCM87_16685 [Planctomycetes bacterium]|nr:hypothetical protein [Planctomycetota bacterium]